jgi:hypothetical protein
VRPERVVGATAGGWSRNNPGPTQFDGSYAIERLPAGRSYQVYAEGLNGSVDPSEISNATAPLCRNSTNDPGWPLLQGCVAPPVDISFTGADEAWAERAKREADGYCAWVRKSWTRDCSEMFF